MAFRFRVVVATLLVLIGVGCRKPAAPADSNAAPETWITAAPQDTITLRDSRGIPIPGTPSVGVIAFRFHLYWAGSDEDGEVRGFYWAVTETVKTPGISVEPPVPAPKPSDYRYTSRTDSTFIFNVLEETGTRRHAFYLAAVDNEGKADPTPARFVFDSFDRFPPFAEIVTSYADAYFIDRGDPSATPVMRRFAISDTFLQNTNPKDTVPRGSRLLFRWRGLETISGNPAVSFKYKFDRPDFTTAEPGVDSVAFPPEKAGNGTQLFSVRAVDVAGGSRADLPTTRYFVTNFSPDTWFSGPQISPLPPTFQQSGGNKFRNVSNWNTILPVVGSLFGPDSLLVMPKDRVRRKTFFEIHKNRIYIRAEHDTVDMNSWVFFHTGGFDSDSPYNVRVDGFKFDTTSSPVVKKTGQNGSPIGFRLSAPVRLYGGGQVSPSPLGQVYPLDEAINVPEDHIAGFVGMQQSGRAYVTIRAVDGDGRMDNRIENPVGFVDSMEAGIMPVERRPLRDLIMTFEVNRAPYLRNWEPSFQPQPNQVYPSRDIPLNWGTRSGDDDPYDGVQRSVGGTPPNVTEVLRFRYTLSIRGRNAAGRDTVHAPRTPTLYRTDVAPSLITVPNFLVGPDVILDCELCDYASADFAPGKGRCRYYSFPIQVPVAGPAAGAMPARATNKPRPVDPRVPDGGLH